MKIIFRVDGKKMKWRDLRRIEEADATGEAQEVMAKFMVGEDGEYMTVEAAREVLDDLDLEEMGEALRAFRKGIRDAMVPPTKDAS